MATKKQNRNSKVVGIAYAYNAGDEYDMVTAAGIEWIRVNLPFPWTDKMNGKLGREYLTAKKQIKAAREHGMKIMPVSPGMGGFFYDKKLKKTYFQESFPAFAGKKGSKEFYNNVKDAVAFMAMDLADDAGDLWQCMNEIDIPVFVNTYSDEIVTMVARVSAEAITQVNPKARCGINLAYFEGHGIDIADRAYRRGHAFGYIGVDHYFGSWQCRTVESWTEVIDLLNTRYKLPVLVNEWGYSSGGKVTDIIPEKKDIPEGWMDVCTAKRWFHEVPGGHTEETQAKYLGRGLEIFAKNKNVIGSFIFCWKDARICYHCGKPECPAECYWGIVDENLKPKKAYDAVKKAIAKYYR
jgi:arabinogalactan endo-1,4-beta-galactosidase